MRSALLSFLAAVPLFLQTPGPGQSRATTSNPAPGAAFETLRSKAEAGDDQAINEIASRCLNGNLAKPEGDAAIQVLLKAAAREHVVAVFTLAGLYAGGALVSRDDAAAHAYYVKSAELGHTEAMYILGLHHDLGSVGAFKDSRRAAYWWRKAAELGHTGAMAELGTCYALGRGVPRDYGAYVEWHRKAADLGDTSAMHKLGQSYLTGLWVKTDEKQALGWYRKAADLGDDAAMRILATEFYWNGRGTEQDRQQALVWLMKSARLGNGLAMHWLGRTYEQGVEVPKDQVEAYAWTNLAASVNERGAAEARDRLEKEMSSEAIQRAQMRTRALLVEQQKAQEEKRVRGNNK
jgi:TPR repeat protein